jgi:transposase
MIKNPKESLGYKPTIVLTDAGYFSYDNIQFLLYEKIDAYTPNNFYELEKKGKTKKFRKLLYLRCEELIYGTMSASIALCVC